MAGMRRRLSMLCAVVLTFSRLASADDCVHYGGYTHWAGVVDFDEGSVVDIVISSTTAYYLLNLGTNDAMIRVVNIQQPTSPVTLGTVSWSGGQPMGLAVSGDFLYVADGPGGLRVVNVSNPATPALVAQLVMPNTQSSDVAVSGSLVFLADTNQGVQVVNVTDPNNPVVMGGVDTPGNPSGIAAVGSWVYLADGPFSGLQIINASNPNNPVISGSLMTPGTAVDVTLSGSRAYVSDGNRGVQIIDVSNPASPSSVGIIPVSAQNQVDGVALKGSHAFLAVGGYPMGGYPWSLIEYDVSNPSLPVFVEGIQTLGQSNLTFADGPFLFQGFAVYYISPLKEASALGSWTGGENVWPINVAVSGATACLPMYRADQGYTDLTVMDLSDPMTPQEAGHLVLFPNTFPSHWVSDIAMSGSTAFLGQGVEGLKIIDVSDIQNPSLIATIPETTDALDVAGSMAYLATDYGGLQIFDVSDPAIPIKLGTFPIFCWNLKVSGSLVYLAGYVSGDPDGYNRVVVVDVSNPTLPEEIGSVLVPHEVWGDMVQLGSILYVRTYDGNRQLLSLLDLSDPTSPVFLDDLPISDVYDLALSGTHLYLGTSAGLVVLDVSQPASPVLIGNISGYSSVVETSDSLVYCLLSEFSNMSFFILPVQCEATAAVPPDEGLVPRYVGPAYPNPSRREGSVIPFTLPKAGTVSLRVFDLAGRQVRTLVNEKMDEGPHSATWDGRNEGGSQVPAGIYLVQLRGPGFRASQKVVRLQ